MRQPRNYDAELKVLTDRAKQLKVRRVQQLGELVIACGADTLPVEILAGALLAAVVTSDAPTKEVWRKRGAAFFQWSSRNGGHAGHNRSRIAPHDGSTEPAAADACTA